MENKQGALSLINESTLSAFKRYFPYVIIIAQTWFILKQEAAKKDREAYIEKLHEKQEAWWRESSKKTEDILQEFIKEQNRRNENNNSK